MVQSSPILNGLPGVWSWKKVVERCEDLAFRIAGLSQIYSGFAIYDFLGGGEARPARVLIYMITKL